MPSHPTERRSGDQKPPTFVMQALTGLTVKQRNVLFYWALGLITVPSLGLLLLFVTPVVVTWPVVVVFSLPVFTGVFLLSPPLAFKLVDTVLKGVASIVPKMRDLIHRDRRESNGPE